MVVSLRISADLAGLAADLGQVLAAPSHPLARLRVVVPPGLRRYLVQQLSLTLGASGGRGDGVVAGIDFLSPQQLIRAAQRTEFPGWGRADLAWEIMAVLDEIADGAYAGRGNFEVLTNFLSVETEGERRRRRYHVSQKMAGLFTKYLATDPAMLRAWRQGGAGDFKAGAGQEVAAWQAPLWRLVDQRIAEDDGAREALAEQELHVFVPWETTPALIEALQWWSEQHPVHVWAQAGLTGPDGLADEGVRAAWAQHAAESLARLTAIAEPVVKLLDSELALPEVAVYQCSSAHRQVEVLRDGLAEQFAADPSLQPRDVLILTPNLTVFGPLVQAAFTPPPRGLPVSHPAQQFPIAIARAATENPLAQVIWQACVLLPQRASSQQLLELISLEPVRAKFQLDEDDLATLRSWAEQANIRWGLSQDHLGRYQLNHLAETSWADGINRLAVGAATGGDGEWAHVPAATSVGSQEVELLGKLTVVVQALEYVRQQLAQGLSGQQWQELCTWLLDELTQLSADEQGLRLDCDRFLAVVGRRRQTLGAYEVAHQLLSATQQPSFGGKWGGGAITVSEVTDIALIPHRLVVFLGFDEGTFPPAQLLAGDDLLAQRDSGVLGGANERHLFATAVLSAGKVLVIYQGYDAGAQVELPPAMVINELADAWGINLGAQSANVVRQPLFAADKAAFEPAHTPANFGQNAAIQAGEFSRSHLPQSVDLVELARETRSSYEATEIVTSSELAAGLAEPLQAFLARRLNVALRLQDDPLLVEIPLSLDPLQKWAIAQEVLDELVAGNEFEAAMSRLRRQGELPPQALGDLVVEDLKVVQRLAQVHRGFAHSHRAPAGPQSSDQRIRTYLDVNLHEPQANPAWQLTGVVQDLYGDAIIRSTYSKLRVGRLMSLLVDALAAAASGVSLKTAHLIHRHATGYGEYQKTYVRTLTFSVPDQEQAQQLLAELIGIYHRVLAEPLPIVGGPAYAFAEAAKQLSDAELKSWDALKESAAWKAAATAWKSPDDTRDAALKLVYGQVPYFGGKDGFATQSLAPTDRPARSCSRFAHYALQIWLPLLSRIEMQEEQWR